MVRGNCQNDFYIQIHVEMATADAAADHAALRLAQDLIRIPSVTGNEHEVRRARDVLPFPDRRGRSWAGRRDGSLRGAAWSQPRSMCLWMNFSKTRAFPGSRSSGGRFPACGLVRSQGCVARPILRPDPHAQSFRVACRDPGEKTHINGRDWHDDRGAPHRRLLLLGHGERVACGLPCTTPTRHAQPMSSRLESSTHGTLILSHP